MADLVPWDAITTVQGDSLDATVRTWILTDSLDVAIDLTGYTVKLDIRASFSELDAVTPVKQLSSAGSTLTVTALAGKIVLALAAASNDIPAGEYVYDLETTNGGTIKTRIRGSWTVLPEATRA